LKREECIGRIPTNIMSKSRGGGDRGGLNYSSNNGYRRIVKPKTFKGKGPKNGPAKCWTEKRGWVIRGELQELGAKNTRRGGRGVRGEVKHGNV